VFRTEAARRRDIDVVLVWRLDRWGRSVTDLLATLQELENLDAGSYRPIPRG
jgi:DNA invertase Pin-like site-specific DNA recombinase